jgi:hypothetical protein
MLKSRYVWIILLLVGTLPFCGVTVSADTIVVPNLANVEGDNQNSFPFDLRTTEPSMRYQQVYDAAGFGSLSGLITQIAYRPDARQGNPFSATLDIQID